MIIGIIAALSIWAYALVGVTVLLAQLPEGGWKALSRSDEDTIIAISIMWPIAWMPHVTIWLAKVLVNQGKALASYTRKTKIPKATVHKEAQ